MRLYLASGNAHKVAEFQELVRSSGLPIEIVSARAAGGMPAVNEDTGTFVGNATKKARALLQNLPAPSWVLSDDSGLCVDALHGEPGVESAYYAGPQGDPAANLRKLVEQLREVPKERRRAAFHCVLVLVGTSHPVRSFAGICPGTLRETPAGGAGFGYDPLFVPEGETRTFAEMPEGEKNQLSHRARAWTELATYLRTLVPGDAHRLQP
jgi:XTP/dITP diphosphohydrolase